MPLIKRLRQIILSQKQWSGITGILLAALVVANKRNHPSSHTYPSAYRATDCADTGPKVRWRTTLGLASATVPSVLSDLNLALSLEQGSQVREGIEDAIAQLAGT